GDGEAEGLPCRDGMDGEHAAARDGLARDDQQVEQQLDPIFRQQHAWQVPGELGLVIFDERLRHGSRVAEIDLRAGRAGGAEGEAAELQARRRRPRTPLDEVEREGPGLLVAVFLLQHFDSVDDLAGRADQIVANARTEECGEYESIKVDVYGHEDVSGRSASDRRSRECWARLKTMAPLIHRGHSTCQDSNRQHHECPDSEGSQILADTLRCARRWQIYDSSVVLDLKLLCAVAASMVGIQTPPNRARRACDGTTTSPLWPAGCSTTSPPSSRPRQPPFSRHARVRSRSGPRPISPRSPPPITQPRR